MRLWAGALEVKGVVRAEVHIHNHTQMHICLYEQTCNYYTLYVSESQNKESGLKKGVRKFLSPQVHPDPLKTKIADYSF